MGIALVQATVLPLLTRAARTSDSLVVVSPEVPDGAMPVPLLRRRGAAAPATAARMPDRAPGPGEQYRFHFDMGACIGCKCCVVACNEQNGNPAEINWRRVGDIEGGRFPRAVRAHLSMSCNHCLEPTCLEGCPVDAYSKDPATGIVRHSAETCIGCQYCTWNCSYGAPQFNPERGVVGKCDMCHGRLTLGESPACVSACPQGAIRIEIVKVDEWRRAVGAAAASGVPSGDHSLSTTRVSAPALASDLRPVDLTHVRLEHPHWPLVFMTVLTQLAAGALASVWVLQLLGATTRLDVAASSALAVGGLALAASTLHLGRPVHAYRALRMWRRSWLSREVLLFALFAAAAASYAALLLLLRVPGSAVLGGVTTVLGLAGIVASACIYRVPARPAWNSRHTLAEFLLTGGILGPLVAAAAGAGSGRWLAAASVAAACAQLGLFAAHFLALNASDNLARSGTARLLSSVLAGRLVLRGGLLVAGAIVLPLAASGLSAGPERTLLTVAALLVALSAEILGRYLFFVSVVPQHQAAPYLPVAMEAA